MELCQKLLKALAFYVVIIMLNIIVALHVKYSFKLSVDSMSLDIPTLNLKKLKFPKTIF